MSDLKAAIILAVIVAVGFSCFFAAVRLVG